MDWNILSWLACGFAASLIVGLPTIKCLLDWLDRCHWVRQQWPVSVDHELGHAIVARYLCGSVLKLRRIVGDSLQGQLRCESDAIKAEFSPQETWSCLAHFLGGSAAEAWRLGRLPRPTCNRADFRCSLPYVSYLVANGFPGIEWAFDRIGDVPIPPPDWSQIDPETRLTTEQAIAFEIGFALATKVIVEHHEDLERAKLRSFTGWRHYRAEILNETDFAACFR